MITGPFIFKEVWAVDTEFHPANGKEGNLPVVVCMVAREIQSGRTIQLWQDDLYNLEAPPFSVDNDSLFVAFFAPAELLIFLTLGWQMPKNVLDLFVAFRMQTNGTKPPFGRGLIGALHYFGLGAISAEEKTEMRELILSGGPWSEQAKLEILNYCESDVVALGELLPAMSPYMDWPRVLYQCRYTKSVAAMEFNGIPIDKVSLQVALTHWKDIQIELIRRIDSEFGVYEGTSFKTERFAGFLNRNNISWPRLASGALDLQDDTFKSMCRSHPKLNPLRELRSELSKFRLASLTVGDDSRNRCMLSMFSSKTGRNQPSTSKFIFSLSAWARGFVKPQEGCSLVYVDWSQQEFGIAAALSKDEAMMAAYHSSDPYLSFAILAGAVPATATKQTHPLQREQFKQCLLGVQFGMGAQSLASRINGSEARAKELLAMHRKTFKKYWTWSEGVMNHALLEKKLWTVFGWQLRVEEASNARSLCNFPMQANGSEMLRLACTYLVENDIKVCAPIHDAILIEVRTVDLEATVAKAQDLMRQASEVILPGFPLKSDAKVVSYPNRYIDQRGIQMWDEVMDLLGLPGNKARDEDA